jgi:hypothetical protein
MITGALLTILSNFFSFMIGLLPQTGLPSAINSGLAAFFQSVYQYNGFFPIDTAIQVIGYAAVFWGIVVAWKIIKYFIHLIRGN